MYRTLDCENNDDTRNTVIQHTTMMNESLDLMIMIQLEGMIPMERISRDAEQVRS